MVALGSTLVAGPTVEKTGENAWALSNAGDSPWSVTLHATVLPKAEGGFRPTLLVEDLTLKVETDQHGVELKSQFLNDEGQVIQEITAQAPVSGRWFRDQEILLPPQDARSYRLVAQGSGSTVAWVTRRSGGLTAQGFSIVKKSKDWGKPDGCSLHYDASSGALRLVRQGVTVGIDLLPPDLKVLGWVEGGKSVLGVDSTMSLWCEDVHGRPAVLAFSLGKDDAGFTLKRSANGTRSMSFPQAIKLQADDQLLLPFNGGIYATYRELKPFWPGYGLSWAAGHFLSQNRFSIQRGKLCVLVCPRSYADSELKLDHRNDAISIQHLPSLGRAQSAQTFTLRWVQGSYRDHFATEHQAMKETEGWIENIRSKMESAQEQKSDQRVRRQLASKPTDPGATLKPSYMERNGIEPGASGLPPVQGLTWAAKKAKNPALARLEGAANIWFWQDRKTWKVMDDPREWAKTLRDAGLDKVLWSQKASSAAVKAMQAQGWLAGRYENFQDVYAPETPFNWVEKRGWPEQIIHLANGAWMKGWPMKMGEKTYFAGVRSSQAASSFVKGVLEDGQGSHNFDAVFFDTTTASGPVEDYSPEHPMTRDEDLLNKWSQLQGASDGMKLVTGSESGHEWALDVVDYFEGMKSPWIGRFPDSGYDLWSEKAPTPEYLKFNVDPASRIPLWELSHHHQVVSYEYWGDSANRLPKDWRTKDLLSVLYAQPELWIMDPELWERDKAAYVKSYQTWSPVCRALVGQKMLDHQFLNAKRTRQETRWEDGSVIRVDFANSTYTLSGPVAQAAKVVAP